MNAQTVHPDEVTLDPEKYQVLDIDQEDRDGLEQSIEQEGVNEPILLDGDRVVVDGHNRVEIARELGLEAIPYRVDEDADRRRAWQANVNRRHMSKTEMAKQYLKTDWDGEESLSEAAEFLGMHRSTVSRAKDELEEGSGVNPVHDARLTPEEKREWVVENAGEYESQSQIADDAPFDISRSRVNQILNEEILNGVEGKDSKDQSDENDGFDPFSDDWGADDQKEDATSMSTDSHDSTAETEPTEQESDSTEPVTDHDDASDSADTEEETVTLHLPRSVRDAVTMVRENYGFTSNKEFVAKACLARDEDETLPDDIRASLEEVAG